MNTPWHGKLEPTGTRIDTQAETVNCIFVMKAAQNAFMFLPGALGSKSSFGTHTALLKGLSSVFSSLCCVELSIEEFYILCKSFMAKG